MRKRILLVLGVMVMMGLLSHANAARLQHEKVYQEEWCTAMEGESEVRLPDATRVDCVTDDYAVEFDFADKWAEAIGQSLHYGNALDKQAMIVLIMERATDGRYFTRLRDVVKHSCLDITLLCIGRSELCNAP